MHSPHQHFIALSAWRHFAQAYGEGSYDSGTYNESGSSKPATEPANLYSSPTSTPIAPSQESSLSSTPQDTSVRTQTTAPSQADTPGKTPTASSSDPLWGIALFIIIVAIVVVGALALIKNKLSHRESKLTK